MKTLALILIAGYAQGIQLEADQGREFIPTDSTDTDNTAGGGTEQVEEQEEAKGGSNQSTDLYGGETANEV